MKTSSCKAKARLLQQLVAKATIDAFPYELTTDDVVSRPMGSPGDDVLLSPKARNLLQNTRIECKNRERFQYIYDAYDQALLYCTNKEQPLVVLKMNRKPPLALIDLYFYIDLCKQIDTLKKELQRQKF